MAIVVEEATSVTPELVAAFRRLTPQLSKTAPAPGGAELAEMVRSPATILLMARDPEKGLIGSL
ncbi:MAG TPA: GNAT family N-acetyltransferase, partial [Acidimicrobiales bacterium]|nr:GNAT family N-acetyltransferase [Acidimicrobiales bacterium]